MVLESQLMGLDEWTPDKGTHHWSGRTNYSPAELKRLAANEARCNGGKLLRWSLAVGCTGDGAPSIHIAYVVGESVRYSNISI